MRKSLAAAAVLLLAAHAAAADSLALPGTDLTLSLPVGYVLGAPDDKPEGSALLTGDRRTSLTGERHPQTCASYLAHVTNGRVGPAPFSPPGWSAERAVTSHGLGYEYCRDLAGDTSLVLLVVSQASSEVDRANDVWPVMTAIDVALGAPMATLPVNGWSIELRPGWTISAASSGDVLLLSGAPAIRVEVDHVPSGQCFDAMGIHAAAIAAHTITVVQRFDAPTDWFPIEVLRSPTADQHARGVAVVRNYCRDIPDHGTLAIEVTSDLAHTLELAVALDAVEDAARWATRITPQYQETASQLVAEVYREANQLYRDPNGPMLVPGPATAEPISSESLEAMAQRAGDFTSPRTTAATTAVTTVTPAATTMVETNGPPASLDVIRLAIAGGQESADGADARAFGGLRMTMVPQHLLSDYETSGYVTGAEVAAGAAGSAFVGDISWENGYGIQNESGFALAGLTVVGYDRVGGGFDPVDGLYAGLGAYARLGLGPFALEGTAATTWSTSVNELRARAAVVTHLGARVLAIGGFYERWDAVGTLVGVSIGLSP